MTLITPDGEGGSAKDILSAAQEHYQRAIDALNGLIRHLQSGALEDPGDAKRIVRELNAAIGPAIREKERLDEQVRKTAGIVRDYAIDFGAARDEIGRRLARLRTAEGSGGVSE